MAISGRHPRSVPAAVKTVLAPRLVIARRPEADVAISQYTPGTQESPGEIVSACLRFPRRFAPRNDTGGRHSQACPCAPPNGKRPPSLSLRGSAGAVTISGRHCRSERAIVKRYTPPMCHCEERSDVAISGRHPRSVPAAVKTVLAPRLVIARRPEADVAISQYSLG